MHHLVRLGQAITDWPAASQQHARRNAMVALTECARRRAEREEVAAFLAGRAATRDGADAGGTSGSEVAAHA